MAQASTPHTPPGHHDITLHSIECLTVSDIEGMTDDALQDYSALLSSPIPGAVLSDIAGNLPSADG